MPLAATLTFLLSHAIVTAGGMRSVELKLESGTEVQIAALVDGFHVGLWLKSADAAATQRALMRLDAARVRLMRPSGKELGALIGFDVPVKSARVTQRAARPGTVRIEVNLEDPLAALGEHVFDEPLPLPVSLEARTLREADALLQTHHIAEAVLLLQRLERAYPLRAWVLLRLGDVALVDGQLNEACGLWQEAIANGRERVSARLARMRGFVAGCKLTEAPEWAVMLGREGRDDPVGRQSALEASWALSFATSVPVIRHVLELGSAHKNQPLPKELEAMLIARLVRTGSPFEIASLLATTNIEANPEGFDLALLAASARCALDIPNTQTPKGEQSATHSWMKLSVAKKHLWKKRAQACELLHSGEQQAWPEETLLSSRLTPSTIGQKNVASAQEANAPLSAEDPNGKGVPSDASAAQPNATVASNKRNVVTGVASDPIAHISELQARVRRLKEALASDQSTPQTSHQSPRGVP